MKAAIVSACFVLCLPALTGCTRIEISTGARIPLATLPVTSMSVALPDTPGLAPGERSPLVATFLQPDGTVLTTAGEGHGKILWQDLAVTSSVIDVNKNGIASLNADPRASFGQTGHLDITVPTHSDLHASLDVPIRYDYVYHYSLSGSNGSDGTTGSSGFDGSSGTSGSSDPDKPVAGGNGGSGGNGGRGTDGGDGSDGPPIQVRMSLMPGVVPLVELAVSSGRGTARLYLLNPVGGELTVQSEGGRAGSGGEGGRGGRGGDGGSGSPPGSRGSDGSAGSKGFDGRAGSDGKVTVLYDPAAKPYLSVLRVASSTRATFSETPLGPLW